MGYFSPLQTITRPSATGSLPQHLAALSGAEDGQMAPRELHSAAEYRTGCTRTAFFFLPLRCSSPFPQPCSALVSFIHAALAVHTYASRGFAKCKAHNNLFACAIYSDKELFLPQRCKKRSREGTNASIRQDGQSAPEYEGFVITTYF